MGEKNTENAVFDIVEVGWLAEIDWSVISQFKKFKETKELSQALVNDIKGNMFNIRKAIKAIYFPRYQNDQKIGYERLM